jgi:hypothetical protein
MFRVWLQHVQPGQARYQQRRIRPYISVAHPTATPGDVGRQPRGLLWEPRALDALEQLAEYLPAAARDALEAMERMASTGFNYVDARRLRELP